MIINFSNIGGGSGGGSGMTPSQVKTMIDNSISGKADTSAVTSAMTEISNTVSGKQDTLVSGTNIKTINGSAITGSGNLVVQGGSVDVSAIQGFYTANTVDDFEGDAKEGDILIVNFWEQADLPFTDDNGYQWSYTEYWRNVGLPRWIKMMFDDGVDFDELVGDGDLHFIFKITAGNMKHYYGIRYKDSMFQKLIDSDKEDYDEGYEDDWEMWDGTPIMFNISSNPQNITIDDNTIDYGFSEPSEIVWLSTIFKNEPLRYNSKTDWWVQIRNYVTQDTFDSVINQKIEELSNTILGELNNKQNYFAWDSGWEPTQAPEGTIQIKNNMPQENFTQMNKWIDRRGYYTQYFNGSTDITATTGNEGDTYSCQVTGTAVTHVTASEFEQMLLNTSLWKENTTYILDVDTTLTPTDDFNVVLEISGSDWHYREIGYSTEKGGWYFYDGGSRDELFENGSYGDFEIIIPETLDSINVTFNGTYEESFTADYTWTIIQSQDTVVMHEGEWRFPVVSKSVKNIVTLTEGEFALLQTKDEHTIYNVVADE